MHIRSRFPLALGGLGLVVVAAVILGIIMAVSGGGIAAGTNGNGGITSPDGAAIRAIELAGQQDGIEAEDVFVDEMTRAQYTRSRGGRLAEAIADRDAPVWIVVIKPTSPISKADLGKVSTYALHEVGFDKETGRRVGGSYYYPGIQPAIAMSSATRVQLPTQ